LLENIVAVLKEGGAGPEHVVRMTWYVTDIDAYRASLPDLGKVYREVMGKNFGAMALVQVTSLGGEGRAAGNRDHGGCSGLGARRRAGTPLGEEPLRVGCGPTIGRHRSRRRCFLLLNRVSLSAAIVAGVGARASRIGRRHRLRRAAAAADLRTCRPWTSIWCGPEELEPKTEEPPKPPEAAKPPERLKPAEPPKQAELKPPEPVKQSLPPPAAEPAAEAAGRRGRSQVRRIRVRRDEVRDSGRTGAGGAAAEPKQGCEAAREARHAAGRAGGRGQVEADAGGDRGAARADPEMLEAAGGHSR
jgi:hypothetical protein